MSSIGLVTDRHRRHIVVEMPDGNRVQCIVRGRGLKPLVGDSVSVETLDDGTPVIAGIEPRTTVLMRIDSRGRPEGVAANITQIAVVVAPQPAPDWSLVDRYLAATELQGARGLLIWNKADLVSLSNSAPAQAYIEIGYPVVETSAIEEKGIAALEQAMAGQRSVLVGQSGVGKSSLINALLGEDVQATARLGRRKAVGTHTTTSSQLHRLQGAGELIDSPGVRQYAPYIEETERLDRAYREFRPFLSRCRFDNCRHEAEPGCAVKQAVADGHIAESRYASFLRLRHVLDELKRR